MLRLASALGLKLSDLSLEAEMGTARTAKPDSHAQCLCEVSGEYFQNETSLRKLTGLGAEHLRRAFEHCYHTLDTIDFQLAAHQSPPLPQLVELANLSSMIGNLISSGIAGNSDGLYTRNRPHSYPDLLPVAPNARLVEIKMALEGNKPKGHLPKAGTYLTFRYVLAQRDGTYKRGKENRGNTPTIWEARVGTLDESDFAISNTAGDSGKTAVIKTVSFEAMPVFYFQPDYLPLAKPAESHSSR